MFSHINDSRRHYKSYIKKKHFEKYSTLKERLTNRLGTIPEAHFRKLMTYWRNNIIQEVSKKNAMNRAKQKYLHQTRPTNFAIIRARLLKRKEEISSLKKEHANELNNWARRFEGLEALLRCFMKQNNPNLDDEALDDMIRNIVANENSNATMRSSASTNVPNFEKV
ncbi:hypothetical protein JHK87_022796 [Glycine soja]|nr:hypothetical protein JHK87_022796 [Glycine soja]